MSYASQADLIERFGEQDLILLTDTTNEPPAAIDAAVVSQKLADADAQIDSWVSARYPVPLNPVPSVIVAKACALARYYLHKDHATDQVRQDYTDALAWLQKVAQGLVSLGGTPATGGSPQISTPGDRIFTRDTMKDL